MNDRGKRVEVNVYDDAMICPICESELIVNSNIVFCSQCDYNYRILSANKEDYSKHCRICFALTEKDTICDKCKEKMLEAYNFQKNI